MSRSKTQASQRRRPGTENVKAKSGSAAGVRPGHVLSAIVAVALVLLAFVSAPAFHWLWFGLFYRHPVGILLVLAVLWLLFTALIRDRSRVKMRFLVALALAVPGLIIYSTFSAALTNWYLVAGIQPEQIASLPDTTEVRYLPLEVAERYARNKTQDSQYHIGDIDPIDVGSELDWVAPRVPTGWWNRLFGQSDGFMVVRPDGQVETIHQLMTYGEGMGITTHISWPLWSRRYWVSLPEVYYIRGDNEVLALAPYVGYRFVFPVQVPYWAGVFVVHSNGVIEDLSPADAVADPRFADQWLYPEALARAIGDAWGFRGGVANAWFTHQDQADLPYVPGTANQMPYLLPTPSGPKWFMGLEPHGPALSIFKMLFIDAKTGVVEIQELTQSAGLIGPASALDYVRSAFPTFNWYQRSGNKDSSGDVLAIEPRPIIKEGVLYWQASITNTAYAGVRRTALVNAHTGAVIYFESLDEIQAFLGGTFGGHGSEVATGLDLAGLSDDQLLQLLKRVAEELERRNR